jgi:hypothetical protein
MSKRSEQGDPAWLERGTMIRSATSAFNCRRLSLMRSCNLLENPSGSTSLH